MALITNNISGSTSNNSKIGITGSVVVANVSGGTFPSLPPDTTFFVSGSTGIATGKSLFGGDLVVSGSLTLPADVLEVTGTISATGGLSGSLTRLANGTSYLVAGNNITITSQSNGQVTVSSTAGSPGGSDTNIQYNNAGSFGGNSNFTYNYNTNYLSITGSVAQGISSIAAGTYSHAEGNVTTAEGTSSHAEGSYTLARGVGSHAEGINATAIGDASHAEGNYTIASGSYSHAGGLYTIASGSGQTVIGKYNLRNNDFSLFVVGNGDADADTNRSDVFRVNPGTLGNGRAEVTGSFGVSGSMDVSGSLWTTKITAVQGFSGSLTRLVDGTSYLIAGNNITITSQSNGSITIESTGGGGGGSSSNFFDSTTNGSVYTTGSFAFRGQELIDSPTDVGADVFFYVSGTIGSASDKKALFGGDLVVSGTVFAQGDRLEMSGTILSTQGFSGSLTRLTDGTSYLVAGNNITVTSQSNGQVTISSTGGSGSPAGSDREIQYNDASSFGATSNFKALTLGATTVLAITGGAGIGRSVSPNNTYSFVQGYGTIDGINYQAVFGQFNNSSNVDSLFVIGNGTSGGSRSDVVNVKAGTVGSGSLEVTGSISATVGISGSLTQLSDGTSYLVAGNNITIVSQSNGQVTISSTGGGGSGNVVLQFLAGTVSSIAPSGSMESIGMDYLDLAALPVTPTYTFSAILATTVGTTAYMDLYDYNGILGAAPGPISGSVITGSNQTYTYLTKNITSAMSSPSGNGIIEARIWCDPTGSNLNAICKSAKLIIS